MLDFLVDPGFGTLPFVCLIDYILMLILNMLENKLDAFELLLADLALIFLVGFDFFGFISTEIFDVLGLEVADDLVGILRWRSWALLDATDG